ncbi:hypothetical protein L5B98_05775 [Pseudomonas aeruginosa]|nr:hypothetical protein [Pseudomonas aeruginosa]MDG3747545.1 hypothetical protein [Pseudomonas aeruginosa]MDG3791613.1 hypothetical protein [Pseudomonas aeruginosa]MDG4305973.1 hypothetical protein [Pseudomonas aeruginosa]
MIAIHFVRDTGKTACGLRPAGLAWSRDKPVTTCKRCKAWLGWNERKEEGGHA